MPLRTFAAVLLSIAASWGQSLQSDLTSQYPITQVASDGSVINAGAVLTLQKDGLLTYGINAPLPAMNTWKNGKISVGFGRAMTVGMGMGSQGVNNLATRKFVTGESFWCIGIAVQKDGMTFRLLSDPIDGWRYFADLKFPFPKNNQPTLDQAVAEITEVLTVQQQEKPATETARVKRVKRVAPAAPAAETPAPAVPAEPAMAPVPPPPPPVESRTVNLGDTPEQVTAALGDPKNIINLSTKQIYVYANLKVTFEGGKVTDVQ